MSKERHETEKVELHPRNKNRKQYDLEAMAEKTPALHQHLLSNKRGDTSIDFSNPTAVKMLNKAILHYYYGISFWEFPTENLCPAIPGRADYIHHMADLLGAKTKVDPTAKPITCLDIGTGASCIYPILGVTEYKWNCIGTDIDTKSLNSAKRIVDLNPKLHGKISLRLQQNPNQIFKGIIEKGDTIDITICNPPFHSSLEEAEKGTRRKVRNLKAKSQKPIPRNFSGKHSELIYEGGEYQFIKNMILESKDFAQQCKWFSSLVSKQSNLKPLIKILNSVMPSDIKKITIKTGNKTSRILAWTFR